MQDLISRQAAIDALGGNEPVGDPSKMDDDDVVKMWERIRIINIINKLPSAQPEPHWIPCSERLPEHSGRYLVAVLDGRDRRTTVAPYLPRCKAWAMNGRMAYWKVIAWLPLPEPYREEEKDG